MIIWKTSSLKWIRKDYLLHYFFFKFLLYFLKDFIYLFQREGKGGRKRGRETSMCGCLSRAHHCVPGLKPRLVPQAGNHTSDPLIHRLALNPLSHNSKGKLVTFLAIFLFQISPLFLIHWQRNRNTRHKFTQRCLPVMTEKKIQCCFIAFKKI